MTAVAGAPSVWQAVNAQIAAQYGPAQHKWDTPGDMALALDRRTLQTPALDLIDDELVRLSNTPDGRLIISMPPQEGKSTRVAKDFPTWALHHNPQLRIVTASYSQSLANRNGRVIRNNIIGHPELGLAIAADNGSVHEWQVAGKEGGVLSVGIGAGLTGRPADMLLIDDPIKDRREADSETYRENVWSWWTDSASTRLAPGAPVVLILTRWHEEDLAGKLMAAEDGYLWRVLNIPAQADHNPELGETDPLEREPGEWMISARNRTSEQWDAIKLRSITTKGARTWVSLYQGHPSSPEGSIFKREWWQQYQQPQWYIRSDGAHLVYEADAEVIASWDMAFKDKDSSDYVCGQVWLRRGIDCYLLDQVHGRFDFVETCNQVRQLAAKWPQAILKLVEDAANGPAVLASLARVVPGLVPETPQGSKEARAQAVTPLIEAGNVFLPSPELAPWVGLLIDECAKFPTNGSNDDQVDALSQALNRLVIRPLTAGETLVEAEEFTDADEMGFSISPY